MASFQQGGIQHMALCSVCKKDPITEHFFFFNSKILLLNTFRTKRKNQMKKNIIWLTMTFKENLQTTASLFMQNSFHHLQSAFCTFSHLSHWNGRFTNISRFLGYAVKHILVSKKWPTPKMSSPSLPTLNIWTPFKKYSCLRPSARDP